MSKKYKNKRIYEGEVILKPDSIIPVGIIGKNTDGTPVKPGIQWDLRNLVGKKARVTIEWNGYRYW